MIVVVGAGICGLLSAYYLAEQGQDVLVLDSESDAGQVCSHANAGLVAIGHAESMANPGAIIDLGRALIGQSGAIKVSRFPDAELMRWGLAFLWQCRASKSNRNTQAIQSLAKLSATLLNEIETKHELEYHQSHKGAVYLFKDAKALARRKAVLRKIAPEIEFIEQSQVGEYLPGLATSERDEFVGGFYSSIDFNGDCHAFILSLKNYLKNKVQFRFDAEVTSIKVECDRVTGVTANEEFITCDQLVLASGNATPAMMKPLGIWPKIYPIKGYSLSYQLKRGAGGELGGPETCGIDETELVSFSRLGDQLRITGFAEFDGHDLSPKQQYFDRLRAYAETMFGGDIGGVSKTWTCQRPSTPSSLPYLGNCRSIENLWLNAGHGQLGWTLSAACGLILSEAILGKNQSMAQVSHTAPWFNGC